MGQRVRETWSDAQADKTIGTRLTRFRQRVIEVRGEKYTAITGLEFDTQELQESFERQNRKKAPGVDGMRKTYYAAGLEDRIADLSARIRHMGYRPRPVRRIYIPKADGNRRPLPCFEDRLSLVLRAIRESGFRERSYGFHPLEATTMR